MNIIETKRIIKEFPNHISILIKGDHGTGKSEVVSQCAEEMGIDFVDVRFSQKEIGDVVGLQSLQNGKSVSNKPHWWPRDPKSKGILLLDELNRATKDMRQLSFEIVLDRRLDFDSLPQGWKVVTCINDNSDIYQVEDFDPALSDRLFHIDFKPTVEEWLKWAENNIHESIYQFITKNNNLLDTPNDPLPNKVYASRRSWAMFSDSLQTMQNILTEKNMLTKIAMGFVGTEAAVHYVKFIENDYNLLTGKDVLLDFSNIKDKLKECTVPEIALISKLIMHDLNVNKEVKSKIDTVIENLKLFMQDIPQEAASNMWKLLLDGNENLSKNLVKDKEFAGFILDVFQKDHK